MRNTFRALLVITFALMLLPWHVNAQQTPQATQPSAPLFSQGEIAQLVAPIALYPDPLLAQILMASTYPLEIVSAARWQATNPNLKGKALEDALKQQPWDASVKSLTTVPQVLDMLNQKLDMTQKLGDAFLAQQQDVLDAVQALRTKAQAAGNLKSSKEEVVNTTQDQGSPIITIEPEDPNVINVPIYNPTIMYGDWSYPDYSPYYYYPDGYDTDAALPYFGNGLYVGNALWGNVNWQARNLNINANRYNNFNGTNVHNGNWQHDPAHRAGVQYRGLAAQQQYGAAALQNNAARDAFRGQAAQGRQALAQEGASAVNRSLPTSHRNQISNNRSAVQNLSAQEHTGVSQARAGTFEGISHGAAQTRHFSSRGAASHAAAASHASPASRGGGGHGGGHGGAGHGGGGHGGGGGRHR